MLARLVGPLMTATLGCESVGAWVDVDGDIWSVSWGGAASSQVVLLPKERHEFGDSWFLNIAPGERGQDLSLLLAVVAAISVAILFDGRAVDELPVIGDGIVSSVELLARIFRDRHRSASEVLAALRGNS
jgi:hypothetical protein